MICGSCKDQHTTVIEVKDCYAEMRAMADEIEAEMYAEAISSWCSGGGNYYDAKVYAHITVTLGKDWGEYLTEQAEDVIGDELCEHGLSANLCSGPGHYPPDDPSDF